MQDPLKDYKVTVEPKTSDPRDIVGIDPADVKPRDILPDETNADSEKIAQSFLNEFKEAQDEKEASEPQIELMEWEIVKVMEIFADLDNKYRHRYGHHAEYMSLAKEAQEKFEKIGLQVTVDWIGPSLHINEYGKPDPQPPLITIVNRLTDMDYEKQTWEVRHGVADKFWENQRKKMGK